MLIDKNAAVRAVNTGAPEGLLTRWAAWVDAAPDHPAVCDSGGAVWTRAALHRHAAGLAGALRAAGVAPGDVVALGGARGAAQVAAWWACWRAGATVMPLDPALPLQRKRTMCEVAGARWLLGGGDEPAVPGLPVLSFHRLDEIIEPRWDDSVDDQRLAYVLFTSGSTGTPKAVAVSHAALAARLAGMQTVWPLQPCDRVLHRTPSGFDVSVEELFWTALAGATLVCAPPGADLDAARLWACLHSQGVSVVDVVPSLYERLLDVAARQAHPPSALRWVLCGGEALPATLVQRHHACWPAVQLFNVYGPTEAVINALWWRVDPGRRGAPPLGHPLPGTSVRVCDADGRCVPTGERGELWLGGTLAQGYLGRTDLTDERFIEMPDGRWYRTGDRVSCTADGLLAFHGRLDHQIKLRGARIELAEVEAVLCQLPGVRQACVVLRGSGRQAGLVAWLATDAPRSVSQWRALLAEHLPAWMRPVRYEHRATLPLTAVGKVDRLALQRASHQAPPAAPRRSGRATLRHHVACELRRQFRAVLARHDVGDDDDFFELGGDSLQAVELTDRIEAALGVKLDPVALFAQPSVRTLTALLRARAQVHADFNLARELQVAGPASSGATVPNLQTLRHGGRGRLADTGVLVCIHPGDGGTSMYLPMLRCMRRCPRVLAFSAWDLGGHHVPATTVQAIAADYASQLTNMRTRGPVHLIGWSAGAVLAYEMAPHLEAAGLLVGGLGLIDPFDDWRHRPDAPIRPVPMFDAPFTLDDWDVVLRMMAFPGCLPDDAEAFTALSSTAQIEWMLRAAHASGRLPAAFEAHDFLHVCRVVRRHGQTYDRYVPTAAPREFTLFLPQPRPLEGPDASPWPGRAAGRCRTVITGGQHLTMIRAPFVERIARVVESWCS